MGESMVLPDDQADQILAAGRAAEGGSGPPTAADSTLLRQQLPIMVAQSMGRDPDAPEPGPTQCHDITVYPEIGVAGGACEGYGILLDIADPTNPVRLDAVADSNFAYWHSATFNNDGDHGHLHRRVGGWGPAQVPRDDPMEWGANAIFTLEDGAMRFRSYYKLPVAQTELENCVAHNGSLVPVPGRDIMVQAWYQGGISLFDFTDPENPSRSPSMTGAPWTPTRWAMGAAGRSTGTTGSW
jgi:hypothetical protein